MRLVGVINALSSDKLYIYNITNTPTQCHKGFSIDHLASAHELSTKQNHVAIKWAYNFIHFHD